MSLTESIKTVAARCNNCGADIIASINYFQLADQKVRIPCPHCGESAINLNATDGEQVLISVPCPGCGESHSFTRKLTNFFKTTEDIFRFMCPLSGVEVCFIGEPERIDPALDRSRQDLVDMITEYQMQKGIPEEELYAEKLKKQRELTKLYIEQQIYDCADTDSILCRCKGMKSTTSLQLYKLPDGIRLTCKSCGRSITIKCSDTELIRKIDEEEQIRIDD